VKKNDTQIVARILKALSHPIRLQIVEALQGRERCLCELQPLFPRHKSTLSRHVAALKRVGLVAERPDGVRRMLRLRAPCLAKIWTCALAAIRSPGVGVARRKGAAQ